MAKSKVRAKKAKKKTITHDLSAASRAIDNILRQLERENTDFARNVLLCVLSEVFLKHYPQALAEREFLTFLDHVMERYKNKAKKIKEVV